MTTFLFGDIKSFMRRSHGPDLLLFEFTSMLRLEWLNEYCFRFGAGAKIEWNLSFLSIIANI